MLQSFPVQDVKFMSLPFVKMSFAKCIMAQIYTDEKLEYICEFRYADIWNFFPINLFPWSLNNIFLYNVKGNADICLTNVYIESGIS